MELSTALHTLGNLELLDLHKVAFLCSRNCPAAARDISRTWAASQRDSGSCVISGFHSSIEKEVLRILLAGTQPLVVALARGLMKRLDPEMERALQGGRLLVVTRYAGSVTHACEESCYHRNRLMVELAEETVVAFASPGGNLERLCREMPAEKLSLLT